MEHDVFGIFRPRKQGEVVLPKTKRPTPVKDKEKRIREFHNEAENVETAAAQEVKIKVLKKTAPQTFSPVENKYGRKPRPGIPTSSIQPRDVAEIAKFSK